MIHSDYPPPPVSLSCLENLSETATGGLLARGLQGHDGVEFSGFLTLGFAEEVMVLEAHPVFGFVAKESTQFQAMLGSEQAAARENIIEQLRADVETCGELGLREFMVVQKIPQHGSGGVGERNRGRGLLHDGQW